MPSSFRLVPPPPAKAGEPKRTVLITGANGRIGSAFAKDARDRYRLRLMILKGTDGTGIKDHGEVVEGDICDLPRMKELCQGVDTVLHLAANPSPNATWDILLQSNIVGTYNTFAAAKAAGCRRVVFASSIHAVAGCPSDVQVKTSEPTNPGTLYGVTKCFGESLGRYLAEQEGLSSVAIRIGTYVEPEGLKKEWTLRILDSVVSPRDLFQLFRLSIDAENLRYAIFHGVSNNRTKRLDISDARELVGYQPEDDAFAEQPAFKAIGLGGGFESHNYGDGISNPDARMRLQSGLRNDV